MNRYVFVPTEYQNPFPRVSQIVDAEEMPTTYPDGVMGQWIDVTGNNTVQVGWKADYVGGWVFSELTHQDYLNLAVRNTNQLFSAASSWLVFNPLQYKLDLGVATPADEAALLAYKQYYVAISDVKNQSGYPQTINWPVAPF
ncbi:MULTISPECIES: tail fiber assembly protein [Pseudomonas]|uniref:tail fiber assembly protein n=1 Tax=Pseudomonas TaxID=286 RepID=UPI00222ED6AC|nr:MULTISPECIES: tail fiber assembly protein [Pseudomonas]MDN3220328.1 tail fiber assembly protein [Pseudomonas nunensis]UZE13188.1 tail fiber assembly protein [Pseudomonas sp. B21-053]